MPRVIPKYRAQLMNQATPPLDNMDFRQLLDNLSAAVIVVDEQLCVRHLNPAAESLLEVSSARVAKQAISLFFHESDKALTTLLEAAQRGNNYTQRRALWTLHNERKLTVDYTVTPLAHQGGLVIEVQPMDRLLRISREEALTSAQETTRNLVRGMAHEIKNPLGGIRGAAQLLARELPDKSLEEYTAVIIDEADRLRNLVDRMLGPHQLLQWHTLNIHELLERVATLLEAEDQATDKTSAIVIDRDYDPSIPDIHGDKEQLIQALLNIANNAKQALQESHTPAARITLRTRIQRRFTIAGKHHPLVCRVDILDNGPGIAKDLIEDIFYPMISGRAEGSGLGLAISQHLINQHHGLVECHSRPARTCFSIYLPMEAPPSHQPSSTAAETSNHE